MADSRKKSVGVIGLGIIGSRVAASLRRAGYPVVVWNRSPRPEPNFLSSAREVSESSDVIQLFVRDGEALLEVLRAMLPALGADHLVMNHATIGPAETMEAARLVSDAGATYLDAPFTGSRDAATEGELVYYVGGDESALESAIPILEASSKEILHTGPVGSATYIKLATNMISAAQVEALAEALALLENGGVPLDSFKEALTHNVGNSGVIAAKLPLMLEGDFSPRFSVKNMLKDLRLALVTMQGTGMDLPATAATAGALMGAVQSGWAEDDFASLARHYSYPGRQKGIPATGADASPKQAKNDADGDTIGSGKENHKIRKFWFRFFHRSKATGS
jgi:3-hydroxyisobutyrate dehydrogenase-like beta-hydroxyacid dehydrogenase